MKTYTREMIKFQKSASGMTAQIPNGGTVTDFHTKRDHLAWYTEDLRFLRRDVAGETVATGPTLQSVMPELINDAPVQSLKRAGQRLAKARTAQDEALAAVFEAIPPAIAAGVSEVQAAKLAGVDRMTVRKALGKR